MNSYPASGFPKPKTQKPCFTSSRHFICKDFQCIFCAGTVAKKYLCTVAEYLSQRNLALGKYLHQQCNSREINNKSSNKIAEIIPVNRKCINIRPVLEKGNKNQPQQGSPTIFTPPEPFQRWHITNHNKDLQRSSHHQNLSNAGISTTSNFVAATWAEAAASETWKFPESQGPLRLRGWAWKDGKTFAPITSQVAQNFLAVDKMQQCTPWKK